MWRIRDNANNRTGDFALSMKDIGSCSQCAEKPSLLYGLFWDDGTPPMPFCMPCWQKVLRGREIKV